MALNKEMFSTYFEYKDYDKCIEMLRKEIISLLTKRIQERNPNYNYTTISALKQDAFKYLSTQEQEITIELYTFSYNEEPSEFELSRMMEIYQNLNK